MRINACPKCIQGAVVSAVILALAATVGCGPDGGDDTDAGGESDGAVDASSDTPAADSAIDSGKEAEADQSTPEDAPTQDGETDARVDAAEDAPDLDAFDADVDAETDGYQGPPFCGNGARDPEEECDDGLGDAGEGDRACSATCQVADRLVSTSPAWKRWLGMGRHPVACGADRVSVAFLQTPPADSGAATSIGIEQLSSVGVRVSGARVDGALEDADPVVAVLPDGSTAIAYTGFDAGGGGNDVMIARVLSSGDVQLQGKVNTTTAYAQHSPDLWWSGSELWVAWLDDSPTQMPVASGRRICWRSLSAELAPTSEEACDPERPFAPSRPAIATSPSGQLATAWIELTDTAGEDLTSQIVVKGSTWEATIPVDGMTEESDLPGLVWVGADQVLVTMVDGVGVQHAAVVTGSEVVFGPIAIGGDGAAARHSPSVAATLDGIFFTWRQGAIDPSTDAGWPEALDDVWLQRGSWDGVSLTMDGEPMPLMRWSAHRKGDQRMPAISGCSHTMMTAWEDVTSDNYLGQASHGDVVMELIPTPILRGTP